MDKCSESKTIHTKQQKITALWFVKLEYFFGSADSYSAEVTFIATPRDDWDLKQHNTVTKCKVK